MHYITNKARILLGLSICKESSTSI